MKRRPRVIRRLWDTSPHAVGKLWAFFVVGILTTALAFAITTWQSIEHATSRRLSIIAAAIARIELSYLEDTNHAMRRLQETLESTAPKARPAVLQNYLSTHPKNLNVAIVTADDKVDVSARPFLLPATTMRSIIPQITKQCLSRDHFCFSMPFSGPRGRLVLFAHPLAGNEALVFERTILSWPKLSQLLTKLPPHFHIFIMTPRGQVEYKLPHALEADYGQLRTGALIHTLTNMPHEKRGSFFGQTRDGWRLGAYQSAHYGVIAGVSLPLKNLLASFARRLEIPFLLISALLISATFYYQSFRRELARAKIAQHAADAKIQEERAFAEQQRDFYLALSELNQFIIRHPEPDRLFAETCRIIVAYTGLLFAWIGRVQPSGDIRVVAFSEKRPLGIDWFRCVFSADANRPEGLGTAGRAVRSGHIEITDDLAHDNRFSPWRGMHDAAGTKSAAALPIRTKVGIVAILALGSEQLQLFSPPLVRLLEGLAQDLAFSLEDTEREQQLAHQARHDALTGLDNRAAFRERLETALTPPFKNQSRLAVAILDLDGFKAINDQFGHIVGDDLLRRIANRLRAALPADASAARLGGDEFGILLPSVADRAQATQLIEAIRWSIDMPFITASREQTGVAASIGVSLFPDDGDRVDDLIRRADLALYEAKRLGKNIYQFFMPALEERLLNQHRLQHDFSNALRDHVLLLYFQPQIELATGRLRSLEALLRWPQPDGKIWAPPEYFPVIEQHADLMRALDIYVLEQAFIALHYLAQQEIRVPVAVNIHSLHLLHPDFLKELQGIMRQNAALAPYLEIEITETSQLHDLTQAGAILAECRAMGIAVALDDFGTGYASLNYLQKLPCDILKIDKSFVLDMGDDPRDFAIVSGILTAAHVLNLATVAEGIEQIEQGLLLRDLGCQYGQGYLISRPLPLNAVSAWAHSWQTPHLWTQTRRARPEKTAAWLARAGHRNRFRTTSDILRQGLPPVPAESLKENHCPLHSWLQTTAPQTIRELHARIHALWGDAMMEYGVTTHTRVATLQELQDAEDALDAWLTEYLAADDQTTPPSPLTRLPPIP